MFTCSKAIVCMCVWTRFAAGDLSSVLSVAEWRAAESTERC